MPLARMHSASFTASSWLAAVLWHRATAGDAGDHGVGGGQISATLALRYAPRNSATASSAVAQL